MIIAGSVKYFVTLAIVLFAVAVSYAQTAAELQRANGLFKQGMDHYKRGQYDAAIENYNEYIKIRPNQPSVWFNRGIAYRQKADAAMSRTDFERSAADLSQAIKLNPNDADYWINRGWVYSRLIAIDFNRYLQLAITDFSTAIRLKPTSGEAFRGRGMVYEGSNQMAKALPDINQAIKLDPKDAVAYFTRAKIHSSSKNYNAALTDVDTALRLFPAYETAKSFRDYIVKTQAKTTSRPATVTTSTPPAKPTSILPVANLAEAYKRTEDAERAGDHQLTLISSAKALELIPMMSESLTADELETSIYMNLLRMRAKAYSALKQHEKSDDEYSKHGLASLRNMSRYFMSANATLKNDKLGSSSGWIMAKIEAFKSVQVCNAGIVAGREWMDVVERLRAKDTLIGIRAGMMFASIKDHCAGAYMMYGDYQSGQDGDRAALTKGINDAIVSYNTAIMFTPRDPRLYMGRAKLYRKQGRVDLAVADEQKAATLPVK